MKVAKLLKLEESVIDPDRPTCPYCGWHNTRLSHTKTIVDTVLRVLSLRAFRCRSCGRRFRKLRRAGKGSVRAEARAQAEPRH